MIRNLRLSPTGLLSLRTLRPGVGYKAALGVAFLVLFGNPQPAAAGVLLIAPWIPDSAVWSRALEINESDEVAEVTNTIPATGQVSASQGPVSSISNYSFHHTGDADLFQWSFVHAHGGALPGKAETIVELNFTVDTDSFYELSGVYDVSSRIVWQNYQLFDYTAWSELGSSYSWYVDNAPSNSTYALGYGSGNIFANTTGSTSGLLFSGHRYGLRFGHYVEEFYGEGPPGIGQGHVEFSVVAVPEPSSLALASGAAACLAAFGVRRRRRDTAHGQ